MSDTKVARRVRWTEEERDTVVRRCQALRAEFPALTIAKLLARCQDTLPPERRRPLHPVLRSTLAAEVRNSAPVSEATLLAPSSSAGAEATTRVVSPEPAPITESEATHASAADPSANQAPQVAAMVETGVQVLLGVLADPRVKGALANLLSRLPAPSSGPAEVDSKQRWVVVAGIPSTAIGPVKKALDGAVDLRFWSPEQPREQLLELLPTARLVIGMRDGLTPAVESSLKGLGSRYVRHDSGVPGLYRRLADEAMS